MINVRRATIEDIPMIMEFLDKHWLKGYALANNRELFDWQFVKNGKVNVWIGVDDEEGKMYAMQGGIFYSSKQQADLSGMLWIAIKSSNPLLGMEVLDQMFIDSKPKRDYAIGLLEDSVKAMKLLGKKIASLDHYYRLSDRKEYRIAVVAEKDIPKASPYGYRMTEISDFNTFKEVINADSLLNASPQKDYDYIEWRYWKHPVFHYNKWCIEDSEGKKVSILISREEHYDNSKACKIVDYYGEDRHLSRIATELDRIMQERGYEFVDIYSYGVSQSVYEAGGFLKVDKSTKNIITNFFQPYIAVNSDITILEPSVEGTRLFRGDSDQDKPRY